MGYTCVAFNTLPWMRASLSVNSLRATSLTHPVPKPVIKKYPIDFARVSVARSVLVKPKPTITMIQPTHVCGRYRLVASIDNPVMRAAGAIDETASA